MTESPGTGGSGEYPDRIALDPEASRRLVEMMASVPGDPTGLAYLNRLGKQFGRVHPYDAEAKARGRANAEQWAAEWAPEGFDCRVQWPWLYNDENPPWWDPTPPTLDLATIAAEFKALAFSTSELAEAAAESSRAMDEIARVFARAKLDAIQALSKEDAQLIDAWMKANPEMGWLDALLWLETRHV